MRIVKRLISMLLVVASMFVYYLATPTKVVAEEIKQDIALDNYIDATGFSNGNMLEYSPLVGEVEDDRTANSKTFRRADGAYEAVVYDYPVHYLSGEEWLDIDNTLIPISDSEGNITAYRTTAGEVRVQFATSTAADELVRYELDEDNYISWGFPSMVETSALVSQPKKSGIATDEENDMALRFPEELSTEVVYQDEDSNISVRYVLTSYILTEFITLNARPVQTIEYEMELNCVGLEPVLGEDGSIAFADEEGTIRLNMGKPVMEDAEGEQSDEFTVILNGEEVGASSNTDEIGGRYTYSMEPSMEWLTSDERAYPVVIDPDVNIVLDDGIEDTYISEWAKDENSHARGILNVGGPKKYRALINITELPELNAGDVIVDASLYLSRYDQGGTSGHEIDVYQILKPWECSEVTWNNFNPNSSESVNRDHIEFAVATVGYNSFNKFDITKLVKSWYVEPDKNYGIMLEPENNNWYIGYRSSEYNAGDYRHPFFSLIYVNSTGLEGRFTYQSQDVGRAGSGSVNVYSGNLTYTHADGGINNGTMPINLSHVFNTNDIDTDIGYGYGWRLNYSQSIEKVTLQDRNETSTFYQLIDGDGTRHYYRADGNSKVNYVNELDKDSKLTVDASSKTITISDKGDNKLVFGCNAAMTSGRLIRIEDANGNQTRIAYKSVDINDLRIASITEKHAASSQTGQSITLTYNSDNRLSRVSPPNGLNVEYYYTNGDLTSIKAADGKYCYYTYDADHCLTQAKNIDEYNINYEYTEEAPYRVIKVTEKAGASAGNHISFEYARSRTTVTDNQNRETIYQFNNIGQAVSVRDSEGNAVFAAFNDEEQEVTQLTAVSNTQSTIFNLLMNHGFETADAANDPWTKSSGALYSTTYQHTGKHSLKLESTAGSQAYATQSVAVDAGETYTLSGYFTGQSGATLSVLNGSTVLAASDGAETYGATGTDWVRAVTTFTVPSGVSIITVKVSLEGAGTVYADSVQLEKGETPNRYNMIENGDFSNGMDRWSIADAISPTTDGIVTDSSESHPTGFSDSVYHIVGVYGSKKCITQTIPVNGKEGDAYSFGAWLRSDSIPMNRQNYTNRNHGVKRVTVEFINGSSAVNTVFIYFDADSEDWQYACGSAVAEGVYDKIRISVNFHYTRNDCYYDGIQLYREEFSQAYSYDAETGDLTGYTSLIGQENSFEYNDNNDIISSTDALDNETAYTYDDKHNLLTTTTEEGVVTSNTHNANGQVTETRVGSESEYIQSSTTYNSGSALAAAVTDARGNSVNYGYNSSTRLNTTITDASGNTSTYSYGNAASMLRLASLTSDGTGKVSYTYDDYGKLTRISRSSTHYNFTYDNWGRVVSTKVGTMTLSTNVYDTYGRLTSVTYGNGFIIEYVYDELDRVVQIKEKQANVAGRTSVAYEFVYDSEGNLYELRNYRTNRATFFEYDHAGRCMASTEKSFTETGGAISYTGTVALYKYVYDANNNLTKLTQQVAGRTFETCYTYDGDNRPVSATLDNGVVITNSYDAIGRVSQRSIRLSSANTYTTNISYLAGANGSQTALISSYQNGNDSAYSYTYDKNGNITRIVSGTTTLSYEYDEANQLVRENLYYGSGNAGNATYTYTYDDWGNIIQKSVYAYTTGDVLEPRENFVLRYRSDIVGNVSSMPSDTPVTPGGSVTISLQVPTLGGFRFVEWNTASNGSGTSYSPGDTITLNDDVTLYAQWEQNPIQPTPTGGIIAELPEPTHAPEYTASNTSGSYPTQTFVYEYGNAEWGDMLTAIKRYNVDSIGLMTIAATETFSHDAMGNPTSYGLKTLTWSGKQLTRYYYQPNRNQIYDYTYAYDENGLRTQKVVNGVTTSYYYNGSVLMGMVTGSGNTAIHQLFSYDSSGNVVSVDYSSNGGSTFTTYYYLRNAQNDIVKIIDGTGATVVEYKYDSWGKPISTTGSLSATLGANQPFRYRGYVYDTETGWYYLQSRYYDPSVGRFVSADVYLSTDQGVLGHNTFVYCLNNPVILVDRQGDSATIVIGGATISFVNFVVLVVCLAIIVDLIINQEDALIIQFLTVLSEGVVNSADAILATWDSVVMSNGKVKAADDPDPYARPDQKKQGRERKNKARLDPKWKPRSQPRPPKKHTPSRSHRKYAYIIIFEEEA